MKKIPLFLFFLLFFIKVPANDRVDSLLIELDKTIEMLIYILNKKRNICTSSRSF